MTELNSIQIIKDMAEVSGIDTSNPNWSEQHTAVLQAEQNRIVSRMADLIEDTVKRSTSASLPKGMGDGESYSVLKSPPQPAQKPDLAVDTSIPIRQRTLNAARRLYLSYD